MPRKITLKKFKCEFQFGVSGEIILMAVDLDDAQKQLDNIDPHELFHSSGEVKYIEAMPYTFSATLGEI